MSNDTARTIFHMIGIIMVALIIILGIALISTFCCDHTSTTVVRLLHKGIVTDYRFDGNLRYAVTFSDGYMFFTKNSYMSVVDCNLTELTELDMKQIYYLWEFNRNNSTDYILTLCDNYVDKVRIKNPQNIFYVEQESK